MRQYSENVLYIWMKVILQPYIDNMVMDFYEGHSCIYTEVSYFWPIPLPTHYVTILILTLYTQGAEVSVISRRAPLMLEVIQCHTWGHIRMLDDCIYSLSVDTSSWLREALFWCFSLYLWYVKEKNKYSPLSLISYHCGSIFNSEEQFLVLDLSFSSNTKAPLDQAITIHLLHNNEELFTNVGFTLLLRNFSVTVLYRTCSFFKTPKVRKRFFWWIACITLNVNEPLWKSGWKIWESCRLM